MRELQDLENRHPEAYSASSPTQRVGAAPWPNSPRSIIHHRCSSGERFFNEEIIEFDIVSNG
jgi:NAD-dependent DNA ligase